MAGGLPDQLGLHIIHHHIVVQGGLDDLHKPFSIKVCPDVCPFDFHCNLSFLPV